MPDALAVLEARVAEVERVLAAGGADEPLAFEEVCRRATTRAPSTVRRWWSHAATRAEYRLTDLFVKDATGHLTSTPRRIAAWQRTMSAKWTNGNGRQRPATKG